MVARGARLALGHWATNPLMKTLVTISWGVTFLPAAMHGSRRSGLANRAATSLAAMAALAAHTQSSPSVGGPLPTMPVPEDNPQNAEKIALGRCLFFDGRLSADGKISCASCHDSGQGWAGHDATDTGIHGRVGNRNSGTVVNSGYMKFQFWDGRARSLEEQALGPIQNPVEMGETLPHIVRKLDAIPGYRRRFRAVFGTGVTADGITKAIAAFERTIVSGPAPFDRYLAGEKKAMSAEAVRGAELFSGKGECAACHSGPLFSDQSFHNLGIGTEAVHPDVGREAVTKRPADRGKFKTPGLRNVAQSYPYMHDGKTKTLADVVDYLDRGGTANPNLDALVRPLNLTAREKRDMVAFLKALTGPAAQSVATEAPIGSEGCRQARGEMKKHDHKGG